MDAGTWPSHKLTSPCEPNASGELKIDQNFKIPYFCQNFEFSKDNQVIYFSALTSIQNMKALAHKIFKFCFQRDITQETGITRT